MSNPNLEVKTLPTLSPTLSKVMQRTLISKSHILRPVVMIGQKGLTEQVHAEIDLALNAHELIKVKISSGNASDKENFKNILENILLTSQACLVHKIGHIVILYREKSST